MGQCVSNEENRRLRAADFAAACVENSGTSLGNRARPAFLQSTDRLSDEDEDDHGCEEMIEFYNDGQVSSAASSPLPLDTFVNTPTKSSLSPNRCPTPKVSILSEERKLYIARLMEEENNDSVAVLRRILMEHKLQQTPFSPGLVKPANTEKVSSKKNRAFLFFRKKRTKGKDQPAPVEEEEVRFTPIQPTRSAIVQEVPVVLDFNSDKDDAPSDEESICSIPKGIVKQRARQFDMAKSSLHEPLEINKVTTKRIPSQKCIQTGMKNEKSNSSVAPHKSVTTTCAKMKTSTTIDDKEYSNFQKLKLQVAVAEKSKRKNRKVSKLEDRLKDVKGYNHLWQEYEKIKEVVVGEQTPSTIIAHPMSPKKSDVSLVKSTDVGSPTVDKNLTKKNDSNEYPVEYDLKDDFRQSKDNTSIRRSSSSCSLTGSVRTYCSRGSRKSSKDKKRSDSQYRRRFRRNTKNEKSQRKSTEQNGTVEEERPHRTNSFDLKKTKSWFFDFQDEFDIGGKADEGGTTGSHKSQASLSLLSQNSMEAQRQYYKEKRRRQKLKQSSVTRLAKPPNRDIMAIASDVDEDKPITGYGFQPISNGTPPSHGLGVQLELDLDETPVADNLRRHNRLKSSSGRVMSAQLLLESKNDPALRKQLANKILQTRSTRSSITTGMEVVFSKPESGNDESSMLSDIDDNVSETSNGHSSNGNHYGVNRRRRPGSCSDAAHSTAGYSSSGNDYGVHCRRSRTNSQSDDDGDYSTIATSDNDSVYAVSKVESKYDHSSVLQRRLDIEAKLRALQAYNGEDDDNIALSESVIQNDDISNQIHVISPDLAEKNKRFIGKESVLPLVDSPNEVGKQGRGGELKDSVEYLIVEGSSPLVQDSDNMHMYTCTSKELSFDTKAFGKSIDQNFKEVENTRVAAVSCMHMTQVDGPFVVSPSNDETVTPHLTNASTTCTSTTFSLNENRSRPTLVDSSLYRGISCSSTRDTLLLADEIEAHVKDVLQKYRSQVEQDEPSRIEKSFTGCLQ